jgi:hypothetical protein
VAVTPLVADDAVTHWHLQVDSRGTRLVAGTVGPRRVEAHTDQLGK